jgi:phage replication initiation protein
MSEEKSRWMVRRSGARSGEAASPRPVTRGESTPQGSETQKTKVDWLNATFPAPAMTVAGLIQFLGAVCGRGIAAKLDGGLFGFEQRHRLLMQIDGSTVEVGALALGGESQGGKWLLQLTGKGCGMVEDWDSLSELLEGLGATITRLDLALDFLEGETTVDDAMDMLEDGLFTSNGRTPSSQIAGDWVGGKEGRTLYVGKAKNGKMLRVYEKGKQLQSTSSEWTRFEVQLGNRDRVIPIEALTQRDKYFAGAYPALESLIDSAAESIPTTRTEIATNLGHLLHHMRRCYGKALHQAAETCAVSPIDLVEEIRVIGMPRRVDPAGVVSGLAWPELQAQIRSYHV